MKEKKIPRILYDEESDILYVVIAEGEEEGFIEIAPDINLEIGEKGKIIGIEIINAKKLMEKKTTKIRNNRKPKKCNQPQPNKPHHRKTTFTKRDRSLVPNSKQEKP
ncbi:MAG: DUF2283 domain-containing protein [Candidatus Jordarchaeaceae archaeon]